MCTLIINEVPSNLLLSRVRTSAYISEDDLKDLALQLSKPRCALFELLFLSRAYLEKSFLPIFIVLHALFSLRCSWCILSGRDIFPRSLILFAIVSHTFVHCIVKPNHSQFKCRRYRPFTVPPQGAIVFSFDLSLLTASWPRSSGKANTCHYRKQMSRLRL